MSSGAKRVRFNTNERALSTDANRVQAFQQAATSELLRALYDTPQGFYDLNAGAVEAPIASQQSPVHAIIFSGFRFQPVNGSTDCSITGGAALLLDTDLSPNGDDSVMRQVVDPGQPAGTLSFTSNVSGSLRIDVVEMARLGVPGIGGPSTTGGEVTVESSSRDVFNETTGLFSPASVTKVARGGVQYRIRTGVGGSGFPGTVAGWLPLAVVSVPNGTTNWDACAIFDVRPLNSQRRSTANAPLSRPRLRASRINATTLSAAVGLIEAELNNQEVGGQLRSGANVADADSIDLTISANREAGFTLNPLNPWFLYLVQPFGLPNWSRYTTSNASPRVPRAPVGIPLLSMTPTDSDGRPSASLNLPTALLGGVALVTEGICATVGYVTAATALGGVYGDSAGGLYLPHTTSGTDPLDTVGTTSIAGGIGAAQYTILAGVGGSFPANAKALYLEFRADVVSGGAGGTPLEQLLEIYAPNGGAQLSKIAMTGVTGFEDSTSATIKQVASGVSVGNTYASLWVPVAPLFPASSSYSLTFIMRYDSGGHVTSFGAGAAHLRILGWRL